jgi:hypothetical protein
MIFLGLVPILCSGLLGLAAGPLRRRLAPSVAAPLLALAALATSLATGVVLCLATELPAVRWSPPAGGPRRPAAVAAAARDSTMRCLAAAVLLVSALGFSRRRSATVRASRACGLLAYTAHRLRISPDEYPAAFTVRCAARSWCRPAWRSAGRRAAGLLAHENAHRAGSTRAMMALRWPRRPTRCFGRWPGRCRPEPGRTSWPPAR